MISACFTKLHFRCVLDITRKFHAKVTMTPYTVSLADGILSNQRHSLAKAITLIESSRNDHREQADLLMAHLAKKLSSSLKSKDSLRLGVSGPPGEWKIHV